VQKGGSAENPSYFRGGWGFLNSPLLSGEAGRGFLNSPFLQEIK